VTPADRATDVLAAATLLAGRPDVRPDRMAVIGFSNGGGTAVFVARDYMELRPLRAQLAARGGNLVASIGLYPSCGAYVRGVGFDAATPANPEGSPVIVPLLALSGGLDDWTPAAPCVALANMPANRLMTVQVYPGALSRLRHTGHAHPLPARPHGGLRRHGNRGCACSGAGLSRSIPALRNPATEAFWRNLAARCRRAEGRLSTRSCRVQKSSKPYRNAVSDGAGDINRQRVAE
jgi:dienelactone hydrolase